MTRPLTDRQRVILDLLAEGLVTKQVAAYMHLSTETIKWHQTQIRRKLDARNTTHAVAIYIRGQKAGSGRDVAQAVTGTARVNAPGDAPDEPRSLNESSPHGNPKDSGPADLPPSTPPAPLVHRLSFRLIDTARKWRIVL